MRYINDNKMPKRQKRIATKITKDELWKKMQDVAKIEAQGYKYHVNFNNENDVASFVLMEENVEHDLNIIEVDNENFTCDDTFGDNVVGTPLIGFHTLNNGFTFFGFEMGGDWEYPVFGIIYFDGINLRGYYPACGNMINLDFKCAFGSEDEYIDCNSRAETIINNYKKIPWFKEEMIEEIGLSAIYAKKYEMEMEDDNYGYNWELIEQDIKAMFKLQ